MADLAYVFLPLGVMFGWWASRKLIFFARPKQKSTLSREYYAGLNFLLNDQTDKAIKTFIKLLDTSHDSVETTLAIGKFFRRRGEVDRAIRLHQNLIAKPNLTTNQRYAGLLELAQDYMCAGVLDRAEVLLIEITQANTHYLGMALKNLLDIYEREKEWHKAIEVANKLQNVTAESQRLPIANYYCELAQSAWQKGKVALAFKYLKRAQTIHKRCVRAILVRGTYEIKTGHLRNAIKTFKSVEQYDKAFLSEALENIIICHKKMNEEAALEQYLFELSQRSDKLSITLAYAELVKNSLSQQDAEKVLYEFVAKHPSVRGVNALLAYQVNKSALPEQEPLSLANNILARLSKNELGYLCHSCGFGVQILYWQCPSCRAWDQVKPID